MGGDPEGIAASYDLAIRAAKSRGWGVEPVQETIGGTKERPRSQGK